MKTKQKTLKLQRGQSSAESTQKELEHWPLG